MCPQAASPPSDIGSNSTYEELCVLLERMTNGSPLPGNVINDVNPFKYKPSNLPDGIWFLVQVKENTQTQQGHWKAKGETREIFSNSVIIGWETTLEFYEGQVPHERKTDWVMQEYTITHTRIYEDRAAEGANSLCRVFLSGEHTPNHAQQKMANGGVTTESHVNLTQSSSTNAENDKRQGSTSKPRENDNNGKERALTNAERLPDRHVETIPQNDYFPNGDYLELLDLDHSASSSSSSKNSSCGTMFSDEYFDPEALLQELEPENNQNVAQEDARHNYVAPASQTPNEVLMFPASSLSVEERNSPIPDIHKTDNCTSSAAIGNVDPGLKSGNQTVPHQRTTGCDGKGPSTSSRGVATSSSNQKEAPVRRGKKTRKGYLCFMPF